MCVDEGVLEVVEVVKEVDVVDEVSEFELVVLVDTTDPIVVGVVSRLGDSVKLTSTVAMLSAVVAPSADVLTVVPSSDAVPQPY